MARQVSWLDLCMQADKGLRDRVVSYEFTGRTFYESADAVYPKVSGKDFDVRDVAFDEFDWAFDED